MSNLYKWEAKTERRIEDYGNTGVTWLLVLCAVVLLLVACLPKRFLVFKSLAAAWVILP